MSIYWIEVDVALQRPPRVDAQMYFCIEARSGVEAELIACQWAACSRHVVMPVGSVVYDWVADAP